MGYKQNSRSRHLNLIQNITEGRLRHASGHVQTTFRYMHFGCLMLSVCLMPDAFNVKCPAMRVFLTRQFKKIPEYIKPIKK